MTVLNQFKSFHGDKYSVANMSEQKKRDLDYKNVRVIKVLNAAKGCFIVSYEMTTIRNTTVMHVEVFKSNRVKRRECFYLGNAESRSQFIAKQIENFQMYEERKQEQRKARSSTERGLEVGDILSAIWGYDQTNYNYYEVTKLVGKKMVEVREISQMIEHTEHMQGKCAPVKGDYIGETKRRIAKDGSVKIDDVRRASKCTYKEVAGTKVYDSGHWTAYH